LYPETESHHQPWLLLIFFFPEIGIIFYLIIGNPKLPKSRRNVQKTLNQVIARTIEELKRL
jgi:cardiolipin synthase